ncbi:MAG: hypothetical protein ACE1Y1_08065 [Nitrosomonadaceae bacterium]
MTDAGPLSIAGGSGSDSCPSAAEGHAVNSDIAPRSQVHPRETIS